MSMNSAILLLLMCAITVHDTDAFQFPTKSAPSSLVKNLIKSCQPHSSATTNKISKLFGRNFFSRRSSSSSLSFPSSPSVHYPQDIKDLIFSTPEPLDEEDEAQQEANTHFRSFDCPGKEENTSYRTTAMTSDFYGNVNQYFYIDRRRSFLKFAMGFSRKDIMYSKNLFLKHVRSKFGLKLQNFKRDKTSGYDVSSLSSMSDFKLAPIVYSSYFRVVADSHMTTECGEIKGIVGGWILTAENITVNEMYYKGKVSFLNLYFVFLPGTRYSTRVIMFPHVVTACGNDIVKIKGMEKACGISGVSYNLEEGVRGWMDGVAIAYQYPGFKFTHLFRIIASWPGRLTPIPKM